MESACLLCDRRIFYTSRDLPQKEVWAEMRDGSCRWRQSASEVKVAVLRVPATVPTKHLDVGLDMFHVHITSKVTGEVYLSGRLKYF